MKHIDNYPIVQYKLKEGLFIESLKFFGFQVHKYDATKELERNKRNEKILIHCNSNKEFLVSYYHGYKFEGYVRYRQRKYLRDLIMMGVIESV